jgi:aryl-alcohol dehydrogenase-like predicted oxidoreductase
MPTSIPAAAAGTIKLGDMVVNRMGFGAMRLCGADAWGRRRNDANAQSVLRRALELGINLMDTADSYGPRSTSY